MAGTRRSSRLSAATQAMPPPAAPAAPTTNGRKRKAAAEPQAEAPSTPKKKRIFAPPPLTPTPSAVGIIAEPALHNGPQPAAVARLADPRGTNAMLLSPETSRLIAPRDEAPPSPSKGRGKPTTTTQTLLQEACDHLIRVDERMRPLIAKHTCRAFSPEGLAEKVDPFESLSSGIISQQVSGAAAKSIKNKFVALFAADSAAAARFPHPSQVAATPLDTLRTAGLSQRKAEYIQGLAGRFASGELSAQMLRDAPYDEVLARLTAVRGLGRWSVEMFACFGLKRMDVFALGDLGVQRGMAAFEGRDVAKLRTKGGKWKYMSEQDMVALSDRFAPYRSLFMWYMWRVEETDISTMES
ncbi:GPD superfamily base excision DNA repair [Cordyceps militaris]|uniref:GPD superfamily base excision DNA repair n=1 Tax=Cordyceps militaris TaxID=73501 RepID=A0A2H4STS3_CORMI|nr:GPD superfamily base excision DNA repair [Cordyceps militaris]